MNTKLLAGIAVFALLAGIVGTSMTHSAYAADSMTKMTDKKAKVDAKANAKKAAADKKAADAKAKMDAKMAKREAATGKATGKTAADVTVDIPKGMASDQNCADKCFSPSAVTVAVGGKVTWKNSDSAAHTATADDSSFDTSMIMAGGSASNTFKTAGTFSYYCMVHPWMKGTVTVQ